MNVNIKCGIISHRGLCRLNQNDPRLGENTIEAFEEGIKKLEGLGFPKSIEFDIRLAKDKVPVIIHDNLVDRTTSGRGEVKEYLFSDLQKLNAGYGRKIPSLSEVLDYFKNKGVLFHVELKENNLAVIIEQIVSEKNLMKRVIVSAFNDDDVGGPGEDPKSSSCWADLYTIKDKLPIALIATNKKISEMGGATAYIRMAKNVGACAVHPEQTAVNEELVMAAHAAGLKVNTWTVNDRAAYKMFAGYGVDNVFCDNPEFLI